jgi:regulator of protease activity HflC (stomatin/prohibitin superfamily)
MVDTILSLDDDKDEYGSQHAFNGWYAIGIILAIAVVGIISLSAKLYPIAILAAFIDLIAVFGLFQLAPNIVAVATFFGQSKGNYTGKGILWIWPWFSIVKVSTRSDITRTPVSKINDLSGNPIMAAMQGQWFINRPASSVFNIDKNIEEYVADVFLYTIRRVVSEYSYDGLSSEVGDAADEYNDEETANKAEVYLRTSSDEINERLKELAQERLNVAGVVVVSANLIDLAYAPEIAGAMLQVQQANAFLSARKKIVKGATSVALQAIFDIREYSKDKGVEIEFDKHQKASLVSNLLVVLCGDTSAQPVISLDNQSAL